MAQSSNGISRKGTASSSLTGSHSSPSHSSDIVPVPFQWHDKQELVLRELEEARARATQMEKTMRWWSDCTANWREKWSKVRSERNKAREEVRLLRSRLESAQRETGALRREKVELENQISLFSSCQNLVLRNRNSCIPQQDQNGLDKDLLNQGNLYQTDSPERDSNNMSSNKSSSGHHSLMSADELQLLHDSKETNLNLLDEMFGCADKVLDITKGVENVSVYVHSASEASKLCGKSKSDREEGNKSINSIDYNGDSAEKLALSTDQTKNCEFPSRENDIEEQLQHQNSYKDAQGNDNNNPRSGNSSSQPSPSHNKMSSDPLNDGGCPISPRISDPLSETSECSETGYAESIRSSEIGKRWRGEHRISNSVLDDTGITLEQESLEQHVTMLKLRLDEATKTIQAERDEKHLLDRENSRWQAEVGELRSRLEDVRAARQEAVKELVCLRTLHQKEVQTLQMEMLHEASSRECIDRRLADLRGELERLQEENAAEWGKRERLETEKLGLERENKKLRSQITDLEERLEKRNKMAATTADTDIGSLKEEIADKIKELSELRHAHCKLKKVLADKSIELQHCNRRADQYEGEVKRLRLRVDELKKELANAEDEVDSASNTIRKLQRSNDEYQASVENLQVQVKHLESRLRSSQTSLPLRSSLLEDSDD